MATLANTELNKFQEIHVECMDDVSINTVSDWFARMLDTGFSGITGMVTLKNTKDAVSTTLYTFRDGSKVVLKKLGTSKFQFSVGAK